MKNGRNQNLGYPNQNSPKVKFGPNTTRKINNTNSWNTLVDDDVDDKQPQPGTITTRINSIMYSVRHANVVFCSKVFHSVPWALCTVKPIHAFWDLISTLNPRAQIDLLTCRDSQEDSPKSRIFPLELVSQLLTLQMARSWSGSMKAL